MIPTTLLTITGLSTLPVGSEQTLPDLVQQLEPVLARCGGDFKISPVNGGSSDRSWDVASALAATHQQVRAINVMRNYGQQNAPLCGIRAACHEVIVTLDDDLQHPAEEIPKLLTKLAAGCEVVYGTPLPEQHGLWRDLASQLTKLVLHSAMGAKTARYVSALRAFRTQVSAAFANYQRPYVSIDVLLTWGTTRFDAVLVRQE